jgi:hypothetical protein
MADRALTYRRGLAAGKAELGVSKSRRNWMARTFGIKEWVRLWHCQR